MSRFKRLRRVILLLSVLFILDIILLVKMIPVRTLMTWLVIAVQIVVLAYFVAIAMALIKETELLEFNSSESSRNDSALG